MLTAAAVLLVVVVVVSTFHFTHATDIATNRKPPQPNWHRVNNFKPNYRAAIKKSNRERKMQIQLKFTQQRIEYTHCTHTLCIHCIHTSF